MGTHPKPERRPRPLARDACLALASAAAALIGATGGCGTEAMGVDACRDIEQARCEAAPACGIIAAGDVESCRRFYRDHCLHGLPTEQPPPEAVAACVGAVERAGACAGADREASLADCPEVTSDPRGGARTACDVVRAPERAGECSFLGPAGPDPGPSGGSGGQAGAASGGEGGA